MQETQPGLEARIPWARPTALAPRPLPVLLAVVCLLCWGVCLGSLYPGLITPDLVYQWSQIRDFQLTDLHPFIHTLLLWLVTRLWLSPAALAVAHMLLFAGAVLLLLSVLRRHGVPASVLAAAGLFYALHPLNAIYAVSLWKDIPYGASVLALTGLCAEVALSHGAWLEPTSHRVALGAAALVVALLRHNGAIPAAAALLAIALVTPRRRQAGAVVVAVVLAFALVKGPIQTLLGVDVSARRFLASQQLMHQVAAIVQAGRPVEPAEAETLREIMPIEAWARQYNRISVMPLAFYPPANRAFFDDPVRTARFRRVWLALALRNPGVVARDMLRMSALVWRLHEPEGTYVLADEGIKTTDLGLAAEEARGAWARLGRRMLDGFGAVTRWPFIGVLLYRGAPYLAVLLGAAAFLAWRRRDPAMLLPIVPVVGNTVSLLLLAVAQDTRYVWSSFLVAPVAVALLWTKQQVPPSFG